MLNLKVSCLFCASLALAASPAFCTVITYADRTNWQNATTGDSTIDFEGLAGLGLQTDYNNTTGLVVNGVEFVGWTGPSTGDLHVKNPTPGQMFYDYGSGAELYWAQYGGSGFVPYLQIILPQNVTAVGLDLMTGAPGLNFLLGLSNLNFAYSSAATPGFPGHVFLGLTSDTPFNTFYVQMPGQFVLPFADNFSYGSTLAQDPPPPDAPEAATFLMIAGGLIFMGRHQKRIRRMVVQMA
jgi:hypothetical protein